MAIEINPTPPDADQTTADFAAIAAAADSIEHSAKAAEGVFRANARRAAETIVDLALTCDNVRVRLDAAKYVVERVMGRTPDNKDLSKDGAEAPWEGVYGSIVVHEPSAADRQQTAIAGRPHQPQTKASPQSHA